MHEHCVRRGGCEAKNSMRLNDLNALYLYTKIPKCHFDDSFWRQSTIELSVPTKGANSADDEIKCTAQLKWWCAVATGVECTIDIVRQIVQPSNHPKCESVRHTLQYTFLRRKDFTSKRFAIARNSSFVSYIFGKYFIKLLLLSTNSLRL